MALLADPANVVLSLDYKNAFNARSRPQVAGAMYNRAELKTVWNIFDLLYGTPSALLVHDNAGSLIGTLSSEQGVRQGCVLGSLAFAVSMQRVYEKAERDSGAMCIAVADDVSFVGTLTQCRMALLSLRANDNARGMELTAHKCVLLTQKRTARQHHNLVTGESTYTAPADAVAFGAEFGCVVNIGYAPLLGTAVGDDDKACAQHVAETCGARHAADFGLLRRPTENGGFRGAATQLPTARPTHRSDTRRRGCV